MPTVQMPDGSVAQFPDTMGQSDIESAISSHLSSSSAAASPKPPGLLDRIKSNWADMTREVPSSEPGSTVQNIGSHFYRNLAAPILHPIDTLGSVLTNLPAINPTTGEVRGGNMLMDAVHAYQSSPDKARTGAGMVGDVMSMAALPEIAKVAGPLAADALNATGRGSQSLAAKVGNIALGTRTADTAYDTNPGAGISRTRAVALTRPSLLEKVKARIDPLSSQRDRILAQSIAPPTDVTSDVQQPFNDISARKLNPRTGAVLPAQQSALTRAQRSITEVQDPQSGQPTGTPKPLTDLTPLEVSQLNRNVYDMADYSSPESTLANQGVKGAGANLRARLNTIAPEATDTTDLLHNVMGAKDVLQRQVGQSGPVPLTKSGVIGSTLGGAMLGAGTTAAAGLDILGSGLRSAGGQVRSMVSPAPTPGSQVQSQSGPKPPPVQGGTVTPMPAGPGLPAPAVQPPSPASPPQLPTRMLAAKQAAQRGELPSSAGPSGPPAPSIPPPANSATLRERIQPTTFAQPGRAPSGPYVAPASGPAQPNLPPARQLPATTAPGKRLSTLVKGWDREATSKAASLQDKVAAQSADHRTMTDFPPPSANQSTSIDTSQGKTPMGTAPPPASTPSGDLVQKVMGQALDENRAALGPEMGGGGGKVRPSGKRRPRL